MARPLKLYNHAVLRGDLPLARAQLSPSIHVAADLGVVRPARALQHSSNNPSWSATAGYSGWSTLIYATRRTSAGSGEDAPHREYRRFLARRAIASIVGTSKDALTSGFSTLGG
jgi:hypothetical protein